MFVINLRACYHNLFWKEYMLMFQNANDVIFFRVWMHDMLCLEMRKQSLSWTAFRPNKGSATWAFSFLFVDSIKISPPFRFELALKVNQFDLSFEQTSYKDSQDTLRITGWSRDPEKSKTSLNPGIRTPRFTMRPFYCETVMRSYVQLRAF